jgi:hypothetical protein
MNAEGKLERIPLVVYDAAPGALRQHVARSVMPNQYNPPEHRHIEAKVASRVLVVQENKYSRDYRPPAETPLQRDMRARLADLRANGPTNKYPLDERGNRTLARMNGSSADDPPERGA